MIPVEIESTTTEERIQLAKDQLNDLEIIRQCRTDPDLIEHKAYSHFSESQKQHSLTYSTLRGLDMIIIPPTMFYNKTYTEATIVLHLGKNVCGHDGIIHGGLSATILDEALATVALPSLPKNFGFTANLNINYKKPIMSDQWVVVRSKLDKLEDRKAFVSARIESVEDQAIFAEATSLYISPKSIPNQ
ncbi:HotDog domain-containing protein [Sporodiniella umbellata]|nr:HotDog domain-containing protein [Sporodiniella umbellata]